VGKEGKRQIKPLYVFPMPQKIHGLILHRVQKNDPKRLYFNSLRIAWEFFHFPPERARSAEGQQGYRSGRQVKESDAYPNRSLLALDMNMSM